MGLRWITLCAVMLFLTGLPGSGVADDADRDARVRARLVADTSEAVPGSTFRLGVHFEIDDGWHIYWHNPGGAGLATAIDFHLPDGVVAGPLQWPLPITFTQSEGIPGYGYEGSVVLASEITVAAGFERAHSVEVRAEVSWLACKDVCVLGSAELQGSLTSLTADPVFREWDRGLPNTLDRSDAPFSLSSTGGLAEGTITHWLRWRDTPRSIEWFPDPSGALEVGNVRIQTRGELTRIDAEVRPRKGAKGTINELSSLVVVVESGGGRRGWELSVGLTNDTG